MNLVRVKSVEALHDHVVRVGFSDGTERDIDIEKYLHGPSFDTVRSNPEIFLTVRVTEGRTIGWGTDLDIDPDTLYYDLTPAWAEVTEIDKAI